MGIAENIKRLRQTIKDNIPDKSDIDNITVVAAVKYATNEEMKKVLAAGIKDLGFNTYQQMKEAAPELPGVKLHFIGHLQRNKAAGVLDLKPSLIQSLDSLRLANKIDDSAKELGIRQNVLLQIKTDSKKDSGFLMDEVAAIIPRIEELQNLRLQGFMTVPPEKENPFENAPIFREMRMLHARSEELLGRKLPHLSMGMSQDYIVAIKEGANMIRPGRILFQ